MLCDKKKFMNKKATKSSNEVILRDRATLESHIFFSQNDARRQENVKLRQSDERPSDEAFGF